MSEQILNRAPQFDKEMADIVDYVLHYRIDSTRPLETARLCPSDALGCGLEALRYRAGAELPGPLTGGTTVPHGAGAGRGIRTCSSAGRFQYRCERRRVEPISLPID